MCLSNLRETRDSAMNNHSPPAEKIALFRSLFRGREDVYPLRFLGEDAGKRLDEILDAVLAALTHRGLSLRPLKTD
jgi:hypothetical protein